MAVNMFGQNQTEKTWIEVAKMLLLIGAFSLLNTLWIVRDQHVWPWDQAWYGEVTLDLWYARLHGFGAWIEAMLHAFGSKPPLIAWVGQFFLPLSRVTSDVESALLLSNVVATAATMVLVYIIGRRIGATVTASLAGVALCGGASLFVAITHEYMVEILQALSAAAMIYVAWEAPRQSIIRTLSLTIIVSALSLLIKSSSGAFLFPLFLYIAIGLVVTWRRQRPKSTYGDAVLTLVALMAMGAAVAWYLINWHAVLEHILISTTGDTALQYGSIRPLGIKLAFWIAALSKALSPFEFIAIGTFILVVLASAIALFKVLRKPMPKWLPELIDSGTLLALTLAGIIGATLLVFALQINEETRYLVMLFPILGVLATWSLMVIGLTFINIIFLAGFIANGFINHGYALGYIPLSVPTTPWLKPVNTDDAEKVLLTNVVQSTCSAKSANHYTIIGVEYPSFNANSAAFYSAKARRVREFRCNYTSLGYAEDDPGRALDRINQIKPDFVVTFDPKKMLPDNAFNRVSRAIAAKMSQDVPYIRVQGIGGSVIIFQRQPE